ncbi:TonB-dependent receptor plug domain-containing protein [Opitutus terrae]|uniref:TonB-dependent receptor plug n=1 Tax=Opitutus terrae (strain DSM 11246 / JCM 15787 / PB90-1) TaxID=452637 RepID=B1ZT60_OPITP|nr:TonB-dependent receptor plug domain-containing protein [Opitutus terrae]ACB76514.1 TonB-dependent receptor plug [Opitutus terrae PB90-1]
MTKRRAIYHLRAAGTLLVAVLAPAGVLAQTTTTPPAPQDEDVVLLSPFEVSAEQQSNGYATATTLAGNRLNTDLRDLGTALSVYNAEFMTDIGATDQRSLLQYTLGTEVGGVLGNYSGSGGGNAPNTNASLSPQSTNRVRGLVNADNTRDLYLTSIPWDGYNVEAVDIQRGPNAILFGQGSAGGVINTRTKQASFRNLAEAAVRVDQYGSIRGTLDINRVLLPEELSLRLALVQNEGKFQQKPAFENFNRQFVAFRYEPKFLKKAGARTIIKLDGELGSSTSNRPRNMPPQDRITPWFSIGTPVYNLAWLNEGNWQIPGRGAAVRQDFATPANPNPNFQPLLGGQGAGYSGNYFGGSVFQYNGDSSTPLFAMALNPVTYLGLGANGQRDGNIAGLAPSGPRGMPGYRDYAFEMKLPFASLAKNKFITDTNVFDFYNNLLDGDIKREWYDFNTFDASISQTFFNDQLGFDIGYHDETYKDGGYNPVSDTIFIDVQARWTDGTNTPENGWYYDGTPNVGTGRPFVSVGNGEGRGRMDRESTRATAFATHDFAKSADSHWLLRILGQHTVTGMVSQDDTFRTTENWVKSTFVGDYYNHPQFAEIKDNNGRFWADFVPQMNVYVGPQLTGKSLGQDLGIRGPSATPIIPSTVNLRYFDSTWTATGVNPADPWYNQVTAGLPQGPALSTQSENPANYRGWGTRSVSLMTDADPNNIPALMSERTWDSRFNDATALVWQGKFWDDAIVATAGMRRDKVGQTFTRWNREESTDDPTQIRSTVSVLGPVQEDSRSWGVVAHFDQLPWVGRWMKRLPVSISATYNKSENFQTGTIYQDYFGQELPLPSGETKDMGVILATRDGKYAFKVNKFESAVKNNPSSGLQFWNYGNNVGIYAQAYHQIKYNYVNRSQPNSQRYGANIISDLPVPGPADPQTKWNFDYQPLNGQTLEQAQQLEVAVINAWDQWLTELAPLPQVMAKAWSFAWDGSDFTETALANFRYTEDLLAEGYEFELHAQVTDNWRMTLNASRIKSYRDNLGNTPVPGGGMTMTDYLVDFDRRLNETAMGDLRIWGPGGSANARDNWNGYANGDLKARLAEQGTVVPENRLWHFNLITNYDFTEGRLKGWSVGGAVRYQSAMTLAYKPIQQPKYIEYDLSAPYRDKALTDFDVWIGYHRKLFHEKIDWHAQLNIANVGVGNELLPVTVQPDGSPAAYRIRPPQQIFLTNTFRF